MRSKPTPSVFRLQHARRDFSTGSASQPRPRMPSIPPKALAHHQRGARASAARFAGITPSSIDAPSADRKLGALLARDAGILRRTISEMYGQSPFFIPAGFVRDDSTFCAEIVTPPSVARAMFWTAEWTGASPTETNLRRAYDLFQHKVLRETDLVARETPHATETVAPNLLRIPRAIDA